MRGARTWRVGIGLVASAALVGAGITLFSGAASAIPTPTQQTVPFTGLGDPLGVAVDTAGDVFVVNNVNQSIYEDVNNGNGTYSQNTLPFTGLSNPVGIAVDQQGDVFVTDSTGSGHVLELPNSSTGYQPGTEVYLPFGDLDDPTGIAVDTAGNLYVSNSGLDRVLFLQKTTSGYVANQVDLPFGGLNTPQGVAVNGSGVYVADSVNARVLVLKKTNNGYAPQLKVPFGGLVYPVGVAVGNCLTRGPTSCIYVSDAGNATNAPVRYIKTVPIIGYTTQQNAPFGNIVNPYGIAVQPNGSVYLADSGYPRVLMLAGSGSTLNILDQNPVNPCVAGGNTAAC
jgi:serine/threonine-protein kinase